MSGQRSHKVPEGFEIVLPRGPFIANNGPIWRKPEPQGGTSTFGFLPEDRHTGSSGFVHGGMIATLLDSAMAQAIFEAFCTRLVTLQLEVTYRNVAMKGFWCEVHVTLNSRIDNKLEGVAELVSRGGVCATCKAVFLIFP